MSQPFSNRETDIVSTIDFRYVISTIVKKTERFTLYKVLDRVTGRYLALKRLKDIASEAARADFLEQFRSMSECTHEKLVPVYDIGTDSSGYLYYTMAWFDHRPLFNNTWSVSSLVHFATHLCQAFAYLHRRKQSLLDITPEHILLSADPKHFGIKLINYSLNFIRETPLEIARKRSVAFLAPELIQGKHADHRIDFYALGALLYQLGTGHLPYTGTMGQILKKHLSEPPPQPGIDPHLDVIIMRLMSKNPDDRYRQSCDILHDLQNIPLDETVWNRPHRVFNFSEGVFVNREQVLKQLDSRWRNIQSRKKPDICILTGPRGIGCRRLLRKWLSEKRSPSIRTMVFHPSASGNDTDSIFLFLRWLAYTSMSEEGASLPPYLPEDKKSISSIYSRDRLKQMQIPHKQLILKHLSHRPTILILWPGFAPEGRFIRFLCTLFQEAHAPLMLCIVCHPHVMQACRNLAEEHHFSPEPTILKPLSRPAVLELLRSILLQTDIPIALIKRIDNIAGGNPYFIEITLNHTIQEESLVRKEGFWHFTEYDAGPFIIPAGIRDVLTHRLDHLPRGARKLLEIISILERPAGERELNEILGSNMLKQHLVHLMEIDVLQTTGDQQPVYTFAHPYLKTVLYESIPPERRKRLHALAARKLEQAGEEPERIAFHYLRTDRTVKKARSAMAAAEWCISRGIFDRAEQWIYNTEVAADQLPVKLQAQLELMHSEVSLIRHRNREVLKHAQRALELFPVTPAYRDARALLYLYQGQVLIRSGRFQEAEQSLLKGLEANRAAPGLPTVFIYIFLGWTRMLSGRIALAQTACRDAESIADQISETNQAEILINLLSANLLYLKGRGPEAVERLTTAIQLSDRLKMIFFRVFSRNLLAEFFINLFEFEKADALMEEAVSICSITGLQMEAAVTERLKATIALRKGHLEEADERIKRALRTNRRSESTIEIARLDALAGESAHLRGDLDQAEKIYQKLRKQFRRIGYPDAEANILTKLGFLYLDKARYTPAIRNFQSALMIRRRHGWRRGSENAFFGLSQAYWVLNDRSRARYCARRALELSEKTGNLEVLGRTNLTLSQLARADRRFSDAENLIGSAESYFKKAGLQWGQNAVQLVRLRQIIDHDLSQDTWDQAVAIWEDIRSCRIWQLQADAALILAKLAMRRGDHFNTHRVLDPVIGKARSSGSLEYLWRALRIQSHALEDQDFHSLSLETLDMAWKIINRILRNIKSISGKEKYRSRPDIQSIIKRRRDLISEKSDQPMEPIFPSLADERSAKYRRLVPNNEKSRLFRQAMLKIRSELAGGRILDRVLDVMLKLSGADRGAICLIRENNEPGRHLSRTLGVTTPLDIEKFLDSNLCRYTLHSQKPIFSSNIQIDSRFSNDPLVADMGMRSVLLVPMRVQERTIGIVFLDTRIGNADYLGADAGLIQELANEAALSLENARLYQELDDIFIGMVKALASAVDAKDPYTQGHSVRVAHYAVEIGKELDLPPQQMRDLELAAFLHDIGKVGIQQHILDSPHRLNPSERELIRKHPEMGARILTPIKKFSAVRTAILQHHERFDGQGYPNRLKGEEISLLARILSVADALDAMTTDRPYQKAASFAYATEQIRLHAGTQFDPDVTAAVLRLYARGIFSDE